MLYTTIERKQRILEYLSDHRETTRQKLADIFSVNERTIRRDIEELSCSVPIYTMQGNGGGIRVADGWYLSRRYLHQDQEELLIKLMGGMNKEEQQIMHGILDAFSIPKKEK